MAQLGETRSTSGSITSTLPAGSRRAGRRNFLSSVDDNLGMECESYRHAISARLDGEDAGVDAAVLAAHLATCSGCRNWEADVVTLTRSVRVASADPIPDLTPAILTAIGREPAPSRLDPTALRWGLVAVAGAQMVMAISTMLFGTNGISGHLTREVGSFDLALAVGFVFAAWRPSRAYGMLPIVGALVACLALTTAIDLTDGRTRAGAETAHLLDLVGFAFLWLVSRTSLPTLGGRRRLASA
jgi:predicted anti-sigma-YlaC factor YlaD